MKLLFTFLTVLLSASLGFASQVDLSQSEINWVGKKKLGDKHNGSVSLKSAKIAQDGKSGEFVVDLSSIDVKDLSGKWKKKFEDHMKSADFFEVSKYPTAKLVIEGVKDGKAKGKMTIKGKTQPVTVNFKKKDQTYTGDLIIDRTKFGLTYGSGNFFKELTADKIINDTFDISFKIVTKAGEGKKSKKK